MLTTLRDEASVLADIIADNGPRSHTEFRARMSELEQVHRMRREIFRTTRNQLWQSQQTLEDERRDLIHNSEEHRKNFNDTRDRLWRALIDVEGEAKELSAIRADLEAERLEVQALRDEAERSLMALGASRAKLATAQQAATRRND